MRFFEGNAALNGFQVGHLRFPLFISKWQIPRTAEERSLPIQCATGTGTAKTARSTDAEMSFAAVVCAFPTPSSTRTTKASWLFPILKASRTRKLRSLPLQTPRESSRQSTRSSSRHAPPSVRSRSSREPGKPYRVVFQCEQQNDYAYEAGYRNEITDMLGPSDMLVIAAAVDTDILSADHHCKLSNDAASHYHFRIDGVLYEFRALPMGLAASAEWMHIVCNIMAGNPAYVEKQYFIPCRSERWINTTRASTAPPPP